MRVERMEVVNKEVKVYARIRLGIGTRQCNNSSMEIKHLRSRIVAGC